MSARVEPFLSELWSMTHPNMQLETWLLAKKWPNIWIIWKWHKKLMSFAVATRVRNYGYGQCDEYFSIRLAFSIQNSSHFDLQVISQKVCLKQIWQKWRWKSICLIWLFCIYSFSSPEVNFSPKQKLIGHPGPMVFLQSSPMPGLSSLQLCHAIVHLETRVARVA